MKKALSLEEKIGLIKEVARSFGVTKLWLFGSSVDNPTRANDIDIAVEIEDSLFFKFSSKVERVIRSPIDVIPIEPNDSFVAHIKIHSKVLI